MKRYFLTTPIILSTFCLAFMPYRASAQANCMQYSGKYNADSNATYVGRLCDGEPDGYGTLVWNSREKYVGEFKDGEYHGSGTLNYVDRYGISAKYIGTFMDGYEEGHGRLELASGSWYEGAFIDGDFILGRGHEVWEDEVYDGEFKDWEYHGSGTRSYINNDDDISAKYVGMFVDGYEEGQGRLELANGSWYEGTFAAGDFVSGSRYVVGEEESDLLVPKIDSSFKSTVSDRDAQPLVRIPPSLPPRFMHSNNSGFCNVLFDVSAEGQPFNVQTTFCTSKLLERASIRSVQKWKYNPKIVDHQPVSRTGVESTIRFQLLDERGQPYPLPPGY